MESLNPRQDRSTPPPGGSAPTASQPADPARAASLSSPQSGEPQSSSEQESLRRHFQQLVAGVRDYAIFTLDPSGLVTSWNEGAQHIKGYRSEEILGQHFSRFYERQAVETGWPWQELRMAAAQGRMEDEGWRIRKDGSRFWANVLITALHDSAGQLVGFLKITRDLTERRCHEQVLRDSEERFRLLVEGVEDHSIFMLEPDGRVSSWNLGAERVFGYVAAEIMGRHFSCLYSQDTAERGIPQQQLDAAAERGSIEHEASQLRRNGSRFWADIVLTALYDRDRNLRGFAQITRDLTERKRVEALEQSHQGANEFLAMLSHELRNPLAPLMTSVDILRRIEVTDPVIERTRDVIARQVQHLTRLVDDLMDVSRITSGRIALNPDSLDIVVPVTRAIELSRSLIENKGHSLEILVPDTPLWVRGDLTRLTQVIVNLLNNSAKYTPQGGLIELSARQENNDAVIRVRDSGSGIPRDLLPRVFDLFTQGQRSLDRSEGGIGVGLALVQRIVELHGGSVAAFSEGVGRGSEFVVRIPLDTQACAPDPARAPDTDARTDRSLRILVVDDNQDAARSIATLLELWGHETRCAHTGPAALELARTYCPHVVLLDIGLPGMDGYEVAARLREANAEDRLVLIAITGYGQQEDRRRSRSAGFDHHLIKPVLPETLQVLLRSLESALTSSAPGPAPGAS